MAGLLKLILSCACSGGVAPVGHRHDIEIKPLAARDNRLGTSSANKVAGKTADSNKVRSSATGLCCCC